MYVDWVLSAATAVMLTRPQVARQELGHDLKRQGRLAVISQPHVAEAQHDPKGTANLRRPQTHVAEALDDLKCTATVPGHSHMLLKRYIISKASPACQGTATCC